MRLKFLDEIKNNEQVVFISGHFNNFELMAMKLKSRINLCAIYRPLITLLNIIMERIRKSIYVNQIKGKSETRELLKLFKENFSVVMIDQRVSEGESVEF